MEEHELSLLEKYSPNNPELQTLWEEHVLFEKQIEKFEAKPFLTPAETSELKALKKQKLDGKTRMQVILDSYEK